MVAISEEALIGLRPEKYKIHSLRGAKAEIIHKAVGNIGAIRIHDLRRWLGRKADLRQYDKADRFRRTAWLVYVARA